MRPRVWLIFSHLIISWEHLKAILSRLVVFLWTTGFQRALHSAPPACSQLYTRSTKCLSLRWVSPAFAPLEWTLVCKFRGSEWAADIACAEPWAGFEFPGPTLENLAQITGYEVGELHNGMAGVPFLDISSVPVPLCSTKKFVSRLTSIETLQKKVIST